MAGLSAWGQTPADTLPARWDLQTCIDYALAHNITVQKSRISAESSEEDLKTSKSALFPSLNASMSQRIVNRPNTTSGTIISGDNISTSQSKTSYNGSYGIDANWTLYNGGKRLNTIKQNELNHPGEHRPNLRADTLRRRSSEGERSHLGDQPGAIRTGQATA